MRIVGLVLLFLITACLPLQAKERILDIQELKSDGGITAWLVEDNSVPVITLRFTFRGSGASRNPPEKQGLSTLLSNTMDEGAGELDSKTFQKTLNDHSITLSFSSGRDNFGGRVRTLSKHKDKAFNLLKLALNEPRFDSEPVERMRRANISRVKSSKGNPLWIKARFFNDLAYQGHPYALNSGGTITSLKALTVDDLKQHKKDWLTKDRLVVSVTGNITAKELKPLLDDIFSDLPESGKKENISRIDIQNTGKTFLFEKDIPQTMITAAVPSFERNDPDHYALMLLNNILGGGFGSSLMKEAREERGLTYGIFSSVLSQDYMDGLDIYTSTKNESAAEMMALIREEMTKLTVEKVTEKRLADAKSFLTGFLPLTLTSTSNISGTLQRLQNEKEPIDYLDRFSENVNAVTTEDVMRVANRVLKADNMIVVMVGKPEGLDNVEVLDIVPNVE